jgi:hypothetical protein
MRVENPLFPRIDAENSQKEKERELREKIKRFNDIFSMLFLVITIVISVGANSFAKENLSYTIMFTLLSLGLWMFGHAIGSKPINLDLEVQAKIFAWAYASLVAGTVLLKFATGVSTLDFNYSWLCILASVFLTFLSYLYLKEAMSERQQTVFLRNLFFIVFFSLMYAVYVGVVVL